MSVQPIYASVRPATQPAGPHSCLSFLGVLVAVLMGVTGLGTVSAIAHTPVSTTFESSLHYTANVRFSPDQRQLAGGLTLDWTNSTGHSQVELPFRLYPNAPAYQQGGTAVNDVQVNGQPTTTIAGDDPTTLRIVLPKPVHPGQAVRVELAFTTIIPASTTMLANVLHGQPSNGWWLADWLPILAGWEPGSGWYLAEPGALGNPTFADTGTWHLALTLPADYLVIGTGTVASDQHLPSGERLVEIVTPPARDLTLVLLPLTGEAQPAITERGAGDILVRISLPPEWDRPEVAGILLDTVDEFLPHFTRWLGPLPGGELDLTTVTASGYHGIAWSGMIWLNLDALFPANPTSHNFTYLEFVLAHELAHLWVNLTIGSNNNVHNFLSESLASHLAILALNERGDDSGANALTTEVAAPFLALLARGDDGIVDDRSVRPDNLRNGYALIYGKGVLGFEAVRQTIGHAAYIRALQQYAATYRFGVSTPEDLLAIFESVSDHTVTMVWNHWFTEASSTPEDVNTLLHAFPAT